MTLAQQLVELGTRKGALVATAESCTGGLIAGAITDVPGSSAVFDRGFVTYSNDAKSQMLGVSTATLETFGAVSTEVAREMAIGALQNSDANVAVSVTGIAGPGGSEHKPEGLVCFALATSEDVHAEAIEFGALGRSNVRHETVKHALTLMLNRLSET